MKVLIRRQALNTVAQLAAYITDEIKMPATALAYTEKLIEFGMSLGKYTILILYAATKNFQFSNCTAQLSIRNGCSFTGLVQVVSLFNVSFGEEW